MIFEDNKKHTWNLGITIKSEAIKDDMIPKHFKNYQEAMDKTLSTDDKKDDILYEYSFNDYYNEVKLKGLISGMFMPNTN